ncbi:SDR family oxidoreductase [Echinicola jeungdonensis]|uniref:SDR family oxidoreductase n=1 Tax=Echinicola jeungdonensis TaxID=709343 RepID=A0ABV5J5B2_9BACT|nr:SDR family oxidoreductase [Echinicola jeungdonensis]MDN3667982.1 SDR family oxidoreductase [Echinicola jeungdonensis]
MENIKNKVIIITGASSGIGAAAAKKLASLGAKAVLSARREEKLKELTQDLGDNAMYVVADVSKRADLDNLIAKTIEKFGQVDVLWNNAGIMPISFLEEGRVEEWDATIDINIKGVLYGINAVLPHMLKRKYGHIITTASTGALQTVPGASVYCGTKYAVKAIMDSLRKEVVKDIRVTTIYPGRTDSELFETIQSEKIKEAFKDNFDNTPALEGEAIADAVIYAIGQPATVNVNDIVVRPLGEG